MPPLATTMMSSPTPALDTLVPQALADLTRANTRRNARYNALHKSPVVRALSRLRASHQKRVSSSLCSTNASSIPRRTRTVTFGGTVVLPPYRQLSTVCLQKKYGWAATAHRPIAIFKWQLYHGTATRSYNDFVTVLASMAITPTNWTLLELMYS